MNRYQSTLVNAEGYRLTVTLSADSAPLWRQPGETAKAWADNHSEHSKHGPWTVVETDRAA